MVKVVVLVAHRLGVPMSVFECIKYGKYASAVVNLNGPVVQAQIAEPVLLHALRFY